jgi:hypothetical protein
VATGSFSKNQKEMNASKSNRIRTHISDYPCGLNGSTQHSALIQLAVKTKAKIARQG